MKTQFFLTMGKHHCAKHDKTRVVFACLLILASNILTSRASGDGLTETDMTNGLFMKSYSRMIANGEVMRNILGIEASDMTLTLESKIALTKKIQRLSVADKTRLTLLKLLAFRIENEVAWQLGENLGDDRVRVGENLSRITDDDFRKACRNLGVHEDRVVVFRFLVNEWRSGERKPMKEPDNKDP